MPGILIAVVGATVVVARARPRGARRRVGARRVAAGAARARAAADRRSTTSCRWSIGGVAVALVSFADTSVLSRTYAARLRTPVDPNQEMVGLGAANLAAGFFQGFPISSSSSRTPVAEAAGAKTQLTGVVGALAVALLLVAAPEAAAGPAQHGAGRGRDRLGDRAVRDRRPAPHLPHPALGVLAVDGLLRRRGGVRRDPGHRAGDRDRGDRVPVGRLAPALGGARAGRRLKGFHDITRYPEARLVPGLVLFRWDAPLFFANAELFHDRVLEAVASSPTPVRWLVVAAEPVTSVDVTAADMLVELDEALAPPGIELCFAEMKDPVKDKLKRFGLFARFGEESFFATIGEAVDAYLRDPWHRVGRLEGSRRPKSEVARSACPTFLTSGPTCLRHLRLARRAQQLVVGAEGIRAAEHSTSRSRDRARQHARGGLEPAERSTARACAPCTNVCSS